MTTKYINGTVTGGYTLGSAYTGVVVNSAGGVYGSYSVFAGSNGGVGLTLPFAARLTNYGAIVGGAGHAAGYFGGRFAVPAGAGGSGVEAAPGSLIDNSNYIAGGEGGQSDSRYGAGAGGTGIHAGAGSTIISSGTVVGGAVGYCPLSSTLADGAGGSGVDLASGLISVTGGAIYGGGGGQFGGLFSNAGSGGAGGAGVVLEAAGTVQDFGRILGGSGGTSLHTAASGGGAGVVLADGGSLHQYATGQIDGGGGGASYAVTGAGGAGVEALANSMISVSGTIKGGAGGAGAVGSPDSRSQGGDGVVLAAGGVLSNAGGDIVGGYGCYGTDATGTGGGGGDGVVLQSGGTVINAGSIAGGKGSYYSDFANSGGLGVWLAAGGTVENTGAIVGGITLHKYTAGYQNIGVELSAGGRVVNGSSSNATALIKGEQGVSAMSGGGATVVNFGTISGINMESDPGTGVAFASASDRLIVEAGSTILDGAQGGGGTLELASGTGTISGLGSVLGAVSGGASLTFSGFGAYDIDKAASWSLVGANTLARGQKLVVAGTVTSSGTIGGNGIVELLGGSLAFDAGAQLAIAEVSISGAATVTDNTSLAYAGRWIQRAGTLSVAAGDTLTFTGPANSFTGTLAGAGTILFSGGADTISKVTLSATTLKVSNSTLRLSGLIDLTGSLFVTTPNLIIEAPDVSLAGGGRLLLSALTTNRIYGATAASTLINVDDRILGGGQLGNGRMILVNEAGAIIDANAAVALVINTGAAIISNEGLIEAAGAGGAVVDSAIANAGTLTAAGGVLTVNGDVTGAGSVRISGIKAVAAFGSTFTENVTFVTSGELKLAHSQTYTGTILGFSLTGATALDLQDIAFGAKTKATYSGSTTAGTLTVTDGTHTATIRLSGNYTTSIFTVASDGAGGTRVVDPVKPGSGVPIDATPLRPFIDAMASFGASGGAAVMTVHPESWGGAAHALISPRAQVC